MKKEFLEKKIKNNTRGITLVALVITIIVLLILAGVSLGLLLSDNGIIEKSDKSSQAYKESQAREKLEMVLLNIKANKVTDSEYTQNTYLTKKIEENSMTVNGDIVIVDGWQFTIDRSIPKIVESIGRGELNNQIKLNSISQTVSTDYVKSITKVEIEYEGEIKSIHIGGEQIEVPEKQNGKYIVEKEVTENGNYSILVKDFDDKYNLGSITVSEVSENMDIYVAEDLVRFRDRVNKGATYEGKTIRVMADLDLSSVCGKNINGKEISWEPIANYGTDISHTFKGTFQGNNHKIEKLYINSTGNYQGLFGYVNMGTISGIIIEGIKDEATGEKIVSINGNERVGAIAGYTTPNSTISNCKNNANISGKGICRRNYRI